MNFGELFAEIENVLATVEKFEAVAATATAAFPEIGAPVAIATAATTAVSTTLKAIASALKFTPPAA